MTRLSDLATNRTASEWIEAPELGGNDAGEPVALHLRSIHYPPFKVELQQVRMLLLRQYPGDKIVPPEVEDRENGKLYAKHLLLGWRNIDDEFTPETALAALTNPDQIKLRDAVRQGAARVGEARAAQLKAIEGNSKPGSATS